MAKPRKKLGELSVNHVRGPSIVGEKKGKLLGLHLGGFKQKDIADRLGISQSAVSKQITKIASPTPPSSKKAGRPRVLKMRDARSILREIRRDPFRHKTVVAATIGPEMTAYLVGQALKMVGWESGIAARQPKLTDQQAQRRLEWGIIQTIESEKWKRIIWSDETSIERGKHPSKSIPCLRPKGHRHDPKYTANRTTFPGMTIMVWGAIWLGGRSELILLKNDPDSKNKGVSSKSYIECLDHELPSIIDSPDWIFMHDNAPIHKSDLVTNWFAEHSIEPIDWPEYSSDLNPIENVWADLKRKVYYLNRDKDYIRGASRAAREQFFQRCREVWWGYDQSYLDDQVMSAERRVNKMIERKGWQTSY
jgi:transposase